ncbi:hypothetical protein FACS1894206_07020 [Deltaproteobacteria bacterium]|nr:hypothetical protein FACS1894206_07020 [Deltaproteobacteria bacterium]
MTLPFPVEAGRPGAARVEYTACREDVEALFAKGYSVIMAYEKMKEEGRFSCGYSAFCDYARGQGKRKHSPKAKVRNTPPGHAPINRPPRVPGIIKSNFEPLPDPRNIDPKTLI